VDPRDRKELHPYMVPLTKDPGSFLFIFYFLFSDRKELHPYKTRCYVYVYMHTHAQRLHPYMVPLTKDFGIMYMCTHTHTHTHRHQHEIEKKNQHEKK